MLQAKPPAGPRRGQPKCVAAGACLNSYTLSAKRTCVVQLRKRSKERADADRQAETYSPAAIAIAPADKAGDACNQNTVTRRMRRCNTKQQTSRRHDSIVRPQYSGAQPSRPLRCDVLPWRASEVPLGIYLTKLRYEASASTSSGPNVLATRGIGESGRE